MKKRIDKHQLYLLITEGITSSKLNEVYDYSSISDMSYMFAANHSIVEMPWIDTSNVTNMRCMFGGCNSLELVPNLNTSNVTNMMNMFSNCNSLIDIDPYNFNLFNFSILQNTQFIEKYPELYI